jgi:hypothetical protein
VKWQNREKEKSLNIIFKDFIFVFGFGVLRVSLGTKVFETDFEII